jgi:nicotinamidase-related amidase
MTEVWDRYVPADELAQLRATGFGRPVEFGDRPCLIVIDVVMSFLGRRPGTDGPDYATGCGAEGWRRLPTITRLLEAARDAGLPRVLTAGSPLGAPFVGGAIKLSQDPRTALNVHAAPFPDELEPREDEYVLQKSKASAFFGTPLLTYLHRHQVDSVVLCGTTTSGCVRATAVDAASHGYPVLVVEDACFDRSNFAHAANLFDIQMKYGQVVTSARVIDSGFGSRVAAGA